ncbi:acetolactate synthase AlsS [Rahnella aquatilis]|jgi:acetolactate synthase-1/2/3 large subunit|uniref:Acetolactate synthase AlsS n=1 Tax=Rahnella sp. (strain Y9602) TaxID=2703885 RepID=A0A0H3FF07_RAHSY|nr:acetolactate synthase AlsS [Rahnella aceris]AFE60137.1 acetolactate synthase [Rahnella aquatilis HX2]AZP43888.1 acetolactate synthase AlsS [Rahnella aquatilis]ADW75447.1 acetolactate synthase, catabolic [Rahnella aceris]AZP48225.1 acetolactate synthase AlsS [Rahnella aquatilis]MBU9858841.1 acetolactate synthase AlsS [Rahnella aceris]
MKNSDSQSEWKCGADLVVAQLEAQGVKHVFGIPGAKIDRVFDSLVDSRIKTIPVRHEANAAFMAGAVGRLTGKAGVALVTSGPGCSNLITGVATATSEGDPLVALGGAVKRADHVKQVHQTMDTVAMFRPVTKYSAEVTSSSALAEVLANGFRAAEFGRPGAAFISLPMDIVNEPASGKLLTSQPPVLGSAPHDAILQVAQLLKQAKNPVLLLGLMASQPRNAEAIRRLLHKSDLPVTSTYQAAGVIDQASFHRFAGRVGLFNNQAGDRLLRNADLVITIGYSPVEYEPVQWSNGSAELVHIDVMPAETDSDYLPDVELVGDIADTLDLLTEQIPQRIDLSASAIAILDDRRQQRELLAQKGRSLNKFAIHPLRLVRAMQDIVNSDVTLCVDMGSFHIWIARYLYSFRARQVLISNGQQTMGVALPWAIGAALVDPSRKVVSVSGDGGFMQSSMELETAVRLGVNLLHIIWVDEAYNMVAIQEEKKYHRTSGIQFGPIDFKAYADAFGAKGFAVTSAETLESTLRAAMDVQGPAVVAVPVDYSDNALLMGQLEMGRIF